MDISLNGMCVREVFWELILRAFFFSWMRVRERCVSLGLATILFSRPPPCLFLTCYLPHSRLLVARVRITQAEPQPDNAEHELKVSAINEEIKKIKEQIDVFRAKIDEANEARRGQGVRFCVVSCCVVLLRPYWGTGKNTVEAIGIIKQLEQSILLITWYINVQHRAFVFYVLFNYFNHVRKHCDVRYSGGYERVYPGREHRGRQRRRGNTNRKGRQT